MQWWSEFVAWFDSNDGQRVLGTVIIPFVAILAAGLLAAAIARGSTTRLIARHDREVRISAIATMIGAARRAAVWNDLSAPEQAHADHVASEADVRTRLLPVAGASLAANWATHQLASMKRDSVSFSFQAEQSLIEFRDRMVEWQAKPARAKKLFAADLERWSYEDSKSQSEIVAQQEAWAATQADPKRPTEAPLYRDSAPAAQPSPTPDLVEPDDSTAGRNAAGREHRLVEAINNPRLDGTDRGA